MMITQTLAALIESRHDDIAAWFDELTERTPPFFYNSVDLRNSGYKMAPVDTNVFPGGFNNLSQAERPRAVAVIRDFLTRYHPDVKRILILAEDHTRNLFYLESIAVLQALIEEAGYATCLTSLAVSQAGEALTLTSQSGIELNFQPVTKENRCLITPTGCTADLVLVNNDLTGGVPALLEDIDAPITPPLGFGWYQRRKTSHFDAYTTLAKRFAQRFDLDPWLITTYYKKCGVLNFKERTGIDCVARRVDQTLFKIAQKYEEYGIKQEPYVFIKSDRGTYGMGIMTAKSSDDVFSMSKDIRKTMNNIKGGEQNTEVIIQEGIPTIDTAEGNPAEPMIYLIGGQPVGCIYRMNTRKSDQENLNSSGMAFTSMDHTGKNTPCQPTSLIAKLAALASAWECYAQEWSI